MSAIAYALTILQGLAPLVTGIVQATELVNHAIEKLRLMQQEAREPNQQEWDELNALTERLRAEFQDATKDVEA